MIPTPAGYEYKEKPAEFLPGDIMFFRESLPCRVLEGKEGSWIILGINDSQIQHIMSPWWSEKHPTTNNSPVHNKKDILHDMSVFRRIPEESGLSLEEAFV